MRPLCTHTLMVSYIHIQFISIIKLTPCNCGYHLSQYTAVARGNIEVSIYQEGYTYIIMQYTNKK